MRERRHELKVIIRPERLYVEALPVEHCEAAGDFERLVCHIVLAWVGEGSFTLERAEIALEGTSGSLLKHVYTGAGLARVLRSSQSGVHGTEATASRRMESGQVAGLIVRYIRYPAALEAERMLVRVAGRKADSTHIQAEQEAALLRYKPEVEYSLPFEGNWWASNGHSVDDFNFHYAEVSQQFGYDFVKVGETGMTHEGDGAKNADFYCYGEPVLAAADGRVVSAHDGVPENRPGQWPSEEAMRSDIDLALGNHAVIRHGEREYAFYGHLKEGTVSVAAGDAVERGKQMGQCGNSGHSTCPHLHFHVMDGQEPFRSIGLPVRFRDVNRECGIIQSRDIVPSDD
ncbi:MAG: M23 family metallopeptidase [Candidatus Brocadiaceae bacterium]